MESIQLRFKSDVGRQAYVVEQGIPVLPMDPQEVEGLRLLDENGRAVPASIESDGGDGRGNTVWVRVSAPVDTEEGQERRLTLQSRPDLSLPPSLFDLRNDGDAVALETSAYRLALTNPGGIKLSTAKGVILNGNVDFQLWPDARSIIGAGAGTCRLAHFIPEGWSVDEQSPTRCLLLLRGRVPKFAPYTGNPEDLDPTAQFDCELELTCYAFSPVIRLRWRMENLTVWQAYLERYTLKLPTGAGSAVVDGERSEDGKFLRHVTIQTPGGTLALTADFVDVLGAGAGISVEARRNLGELTLDDVGRLAGDGEFEPHRVLAAESDDGRGLDLVIGGINPPQDGSQTAANPRVHRLFYLGMGRSFEGSLIVEPAHGQIEAELNPVYFELEPDHYSRTGALPENGDPVSFGEFEGQVRACAEWLLGRQWRGTLWWGEWWREWDIYRRQGIEGTSSGNSALAPLYHFWRTGDQRFAQCAKRSLEFTYNVQLSKRRRGLGPFFQSRRFLMDQLEWFHPRYQRIDGSMKASHFLGNRRVRNKIVEAMRSFASHIYADGNPGAGNISRGKRSRAGSDCVNFVETLVHCWRETGDESFLDKARRMCGWAYREAARNEARGDPGNSNYWRYVLRGVLAYAKATGDERAAKWFVEKERTNLERGGDPKWGFVFNHCWYAVEAEKMSGDKSLPDRARELLLGALGDLKPDGGFTSITAYPWSKWPSTWDRQYDVNHVAAYAPALAARLAVLEKERKDR